MKKAVVVGWCAAGVAICQQPKFELADVHSSTTSRIAAQNLGGVLRAGKYFNRDATMLELIEAAYKVKEDAIAGGPGWVASDLFDVIAKVPQGTKMAEANQMLQALLADRFKLVVKHETHPVPRYVLTVGKGGSKLKPASGSGQGCQPVPQPGEGSGSDPASEALANAPPVARARASRRWGSGRESAHSSPPASHTKSLRVVDPSPVRSRAA